MSVPDNTGVPLRWNMMLAKLLEHDPKALLAGGAIRDLICGKPVRDLDFWVTTWNATFGTDLKQWGTLSRMTMGSQEYGTGNISDDNSENIVHQVWKIKPYWWLPDAWQTTINIIWCKEWADPLELIEKFDFGLCMVAYDGKQIIRSRHFDHDYENKVFTLRRALDPHRIAKSTDRYNRKFKRKYGWPMELSGMARLDLMLASWKRAGTLKQPDEEGYVF